MRMQQKQTKNCHKIIHGKLNPTELYDFNSLSLAMCLNKRKRCHKISQYKETNNKVTTSLPTVSSVICNLKTIRFPPRDVLTMFCKFRNNSNYHAETKWWTERKMTRQMVIQIM